MNLFQRIGRMFRKRNLPERLMLELPQPLPLQPSAVFDAVDFQLGDRFASHPGHGATPRRIVEIFQLAEMGYPRLQCDLFEDIVESDAHLRSQLDDRVEAVAGKSWIVQAGGDSAADVEAARALEAALRLVPNFQETLEHQLSANGYGYAASEIVWERKDGATVPVWFANVPHRRFIFDILDDSPRLLTGKEPVKGVQLQPGKWWVSRRRGRVAVRAGLLRTATWWALFKRLAVRDWVVFAERFGIPYVHGTYNASTPDEEKAILKKAVQSLGKDGSAIFSDACQIVIDNMKEGGKTTDVHGAITSLCNAEISKLITGSTLMSETSGPGSFALGRVHQARSFDLVVSDAERLATRFELDIGKPFVTFNGLNARPPRLKLHVIRESDPTERATIMGIVANELGVNLDEEQVRQEFALKAPTGEPVKGRRPPPPAPGAPPAPPAP